MNLGILYEILDDFRDYVRKADCADWSTGPSGLDTDQATQAIHQWAIEEFEGLLIDDVQKPNDEDYGECTVCDTCEVIIDPELKEYECNCVLRNALRAELKQKLKEKED